MQAKNRRFGGAGWAVGRKMKEHKRDCQRCGQTFTTKRLVPYCPSCFREKQEEHRAWARKDTPPNGHG